MSTTDPSILIRFSAFTISFPFYHHHQYLSLFSLPPFSFSLLFLLPISLSLPYDEEAGGVPSSLSEGELGAEGHHLP
jgi:hypothetical protein